MTKGIALYAYADNGNPYIDRSLRICRLFGLRALSRGPSSVPAAGMPDDHWSYIVRPPTTDCIVRHSGKLCVFSCESGAMPGKSSDRH